MLPDYPEDTAKSAIKDGLDISSNSGGCFSYTALIKQHTENISVELPQNPKQF